MREWKKLVSLAGIALLVGCQNITPETQGAVVGGVVGGLIGNDVSDGSVWGTVAGTLVGSYVGEKIAESFKTYRPRIVRTMETSKSNVVTQWQDPDGVRYVLVPRPAVRDQGKICRHFTLTIDSEGDREVLRGIACRKSKDNWVIASQ